MEKKQIQALKRLAPKLSALRKALRGEERTILDEMVRSFQSEVTSHSAKPASRKTASKTTEVGMHSASVGQKSASKTPTKTSEVSLHSASVGQKSTSKTPAIDSQKSVGRASIDLQAGVYRVTIL